MDNPYLLTYEHESGNMFAWFYTEDEMDEFITQNKIHVIEAFHIIAAESIR